jgi:hypothetical protein
MNQQNAAMNPKSLALKEAISKAEGLASQYGSFRKDEEAQRKARYDRRMGNATAIDRHDNDSLEARRGMANTYTSLSAVKKSTRVEEPPTIDGYNPNPALKASMSRYLKNQSTRLSMPRTKREESGSPSPFKASKIFNGS